MNGSYDPGATAGLAADEFDRLVDFTVDALSPGEAAQVAHLVATNPGWTRAHAQLVAADALVRAELAHAGRVAPTMPDDVVVRLSETVQDLARTRNVVSFAKARERRSRWRMSLGVAAAAAGVVAVLGGLVFTMDHAKSTGGGTSAAAPQAASERGNAGGAVPSPGAAPFDSAGPALFSSGTNYTAGSLNRLAARAVPSAQVAAPQPPLTKSDTAGGGTSDLQATAPTPLRRLVDRPALNACLGAIQTAHPGTVVEVDYARFNGSPALIVVVRQVNGSMVIAAGPDCGLSGADELAAVTAP